MVSQSDSEMCETITIEFADKLPLGMPMFYSINRFEILQNLGNYTFAAQFKADEFIRKYIDLLKKPEPTKINRLPVPWYESFV